MTHLSLSLRLGSLSAIVVALAAIASATQPPSGIGQPIPKVVFVNADGAKTSLDDLKDARAIVVAFLSFDCPVSNAQTVTLAGLAKEYRAPAVRFIGVCAGESDAAAVARSARTFDLPFPVYADGRLEIADAFSAQVTPEVFVLDERLILRYRGRIDDSYGGRLKPNPAVTRHDLKQAIDSVLAGKEVATALTQPIGCRIVRPTPAVSPSGGVTYYREVLPILQQHCQGCHRPGDSGPFSLLTPQQAVRWAEDIKEFSQSRRMPPWKPIAGGPFADERRMSDPEIATLAAWVDGGTPLGDPAAAPPPRSFRTGWQLGEPDLILTPEADFQLGPTGPDLNRWFVLPTSLPGDQALAAVEVRPGNTRVVHHASVLIDPRDPSAALEEARKHRPAGPEEYGDAGPGINSMPNFIGNAGVGGWVPGSRARYFPDSTAVMLQRGRNVVMGVHYHRDGRSEKDRTQIGLYFHRKPAARLLQNIILLGDINTIPANEPDYRVTGGIVVGRDCTVYAVWPHMHLVGRRIKVTMTPPDAPSVVLVDVADWDFNWQETYYFDKPLTIKAGTRLDVEAHYDNSAGNPLNPNRPPKPVKDGNDSTDEMCFVLFPAISDVPGMIPLVYIDPEAWNFFLPYRFRYPLVEQIAAGLNGAVRQPILLVVGALVVGALLWRRRVFPAVMALNAVGGSMLLARFASGRLDELIFFGAATYLTAALVLAGCVTNRPTKLGMVAVGVVLLVSISLSPMYLRGLHPLPAILSLAGGAGIAVVCYAIAVRGQQAAKADASPLS